VLTPRIVVLAALEPLDRLFPVVQEHDLVKARTRLDGHAFEGIDLVQASQVLREDHVTPAAQVGRRQGHRPENLMRAVVGVLPTAHQPVQAVDVQVQGAGVPLCVEGGKGGLPYSGRAVQMDENSHRRRLAPALRDHS
jgi:hypothetical protein